ncbi:MAG: N-acetylneuraminate lyase [Chloroflexi bacterium]|nr:N-acetylneuraminate lyase [Chloroflexota bacterium]
MSMYYHIKGIVPAVFTPMHSNGSLNLDLVEPMTDQLVSEDIGGLYVCGSTGEGPSLTREERMAVAEAYIAAAAGRVPVIVQVGHNSITEAQTLAAHAQKAGADAISAVPPSYFKPSSLGNLVDILSDIMSGAPELPFYYYHIPRLTAVDLDAVKFLEVSAERLPNLVGIKYSTFTVFELQACLAVENGHYNILFGSDEMLLSGLVTGAHGAVGSTYNFAAPLYNRIIAAFERADIAEARRCQALSVEMTRRMFQHGVGNAPLKYAMKHIGFDCGPVRRPLVALTEEEESGLRQDLEEIGFFQWARQ